MFGITDFQRALELISDKLARWAQAVLLLLPNLLIAILILTVTYFVAKLINRVVERLLTRVSPSITLNQLIATIVHVAVLLIGLFFTLEVLQLDKTVTSLLAGVGIIGLALVLLSRTLRPTLSAVFSLPCSGRLRWATLFRRKPILVLLSASICARSTCAR